MKHLIGVFGGAAMAIVGSLAHAESWTLDGSASHLAFGSIKNDYNGESHSFSGLSGSVTEDGKVAIDVDLSSVQTNIDIRNERMIEHVFKGAQTAQITAEIDMAEVNKLAIGESTNVEVEGMVNIIGTEASVDAEMFVMRLSETQAMVATNGMAFLAMEDVGLMAGIDKLMELAGLDGITRASPVTMRLIFTIGDEQA